MRVCTSSPRHQPHNNTHINNNIISPVNSRHEWTTIHTLMSQHTTPRTRDTILVTSSPPQYGINGGCTNRISRHAAVCRPRHTSLPGLVAAATAGTTGQTPQFTAITPMLHLLPPHMPRAAQYRHAGVSLPPITVTFHATFSLWLPMDITARHATPHVCRHGHWGRRSLRHIGYAGGDGQRATRPRHDEPH